MHEAMLYKKLKGKNIQCTACKQNCEIKEGNTGICAVRQNKDGKLYLLVYGKASAVNIDPIEKKPLFHFLPGTQIFSLGTVGCNFSCSFCQNWDLSQCTKDLKVKLLKEKKPALIGVEVGKMGYELSPQKIVDICIEKNIPSIAFTYNEPVIFFEYAYDTAKLAKKHGIKTVFVSNGYESEEALEKLHPYLDAMNIDIKAFTDKFYLRLCKARLQPVLETVKHAKKLGIWVEITTLLIPGENDSEKELKELAEFIASVDKDMPWHVTAFHPDYKMLDKEATPHASLIKAYDIGRKAGLRYVYLGNIMDDKRSNTYCPKCNELLIERHWHKVEMKNLKDGKCRKCKEKIAGIWE